MTDNTQDTNDLDQLLDEVFQELEAEERAADPKTELLLALMDGPFQVLRDDTFPDPDRILVYDPEATPVVQALTFDEATAKYPCGGYGSLWCPADLDEIKKEKRKCLAETLDSYARDEQGKTEDLVCGTPCLVVRGASFPHSWVTIKACIK
jgi:hypothetical protein